jgi:ribosomal protein S18 acetylase RimI-like enzyme
MLTSPPTTAKAPFTIRAALPADAPSISELYVRTYTPNDAGHARDYYPFPQIMDPYCVIQLLKSNKITWLIAVVPGGQIIGSAAAVQNIGGENDRIAEVFGVAVAQNLRLHGVGSALLRTLVDRLRKAAEYVFCEARTAEPGGWKVARNAGFLPIGFEPYAHRMPIGYESMVLTGLSLKNGVWPASPTAADATNLSSGLAEAVCGKATSSHITKNVIPRRQAQNTRNVRVYKDNELGKTSYASLSDSSCRPTAFVAFSSLQGLDETTSRFDHRYYRTFLNEAEVGAAWVVYDRIDGRARLYGFRASVEGIEVECLRGIVDDLERAADEVPLGIIIWTRSDTSTIQHELESIGFFPTVYCPQLLSAAKTPADAIQHTRLTRHSLETSARFVTAREWPEAERVIRQVLQSESQKQDQQRIFAMPERRGLT